MPPGAFDAVISRVGFIYFPDQHAAFAGMREAAWSEIERDLSRYETANGFEGPCELLVAAGAAPA